MYYNIIIFRIKIILYFKIKVNNLHGFINKISHIFKSLNLVWILYSTVNL